MRRSIGGPRGVVVVVAPAVAVGVVPLHRIHWERVAPLIHVNLIRIEVVEVIVTVAVHVCVRPLFRVSRPHVGPVWDAPGRVRVRVAVSVRVRATVAVHGGRAGHVDAGVGLVGGFRIVTKTVTVGVVPLGAIGRERIHDAVTLIGAVVPVVVLVNVREPEVHALVVSPVRGHDVVAVRAPRNPVDRSAIVVVSRSTAARTWAAETVDLCLGVRLIDVGRCTVGAVPVESYSHLAAVRAEFDRSA